MSQKTTNDMVESLNKIKLTNGINIAAKNSKQYHAMDYEQDHPKLTAPPQAVNTNENPSQPPPPGGQQ